MLNRREFVRTTATASSLLATGGLGAVSNGVSEARALLRSFANPPQTGMRTEEVVEAMLAFGEVGKSTILEAVYDDNENMRFLGIHCISQLHVEFEPRIEQIGDILNHPDKQIAIHGPRLLWRYGAKANFAVPKLERWFAHDDPYRRALSAKAVAIIDDSRLDDAVAILRPLLGEPPYDTFARHCLSALGVED